MPFECNGKKRKLAKREKAKKQNKIIESEEKNMKIEKSKVSLIVAIVMTAVLMLFCVGCGESGDSGGGETVEDSGDIVVLYTNDVHCAVDEYMGYATLSAYKDDMELLYDNVALVDCGDAITGDYLGTISEGGSIIDIMNFVGYDVAVLGNHEFDYGMERLGELVEIADYDYICSNLTYNGSQESYIEDIKAYSIMDFGTKKVGFVGVTTPETVASSSPTYFMENGEYVYSFTDFGDKDDYYNIVQNAVDDCLAEGVDYIIALCHVGDGEDSMSLENSYITADLVANTNGIDAVLDGHSHIEVANRVVYNKDNAGVIVSSSGSSLQSIGKLVIGSNGDITTTFVSEYNSVNEETDNYVNAILDEVETEMGKVIASTDIALTGVNASGVRAVRNRETTIGNFVADAFRSFSGADIAIANGGSIRSDLDAGDVSYSDLISVQPYANGLYMVETTGEEILTALELACQYTQYESVSDGNPLGESGGFLQVSGIKYTINTAIETSVVVDDYGSFVSVGQTRRVSDVYVQNSDGEYELLQNDKSYSLASNGYLIQNGGDGFNMFADNKLLLDDGLSEYQVLVAYLTDTLEGNLSQLYSSVEGRITVA